MPKLFEVSNFSVKAGSKTLVSDLNLEIDTGEIHVLMGPNGSGKSSFIAGLSGVPGYEVISGSVILDSVDLLPLEVYQRFEAGLFVSYQYGIEIPGVTLNDIYQIKGVNTHLESRLKELAEALSLAPDILTRSLNCDLSGGEYKRKEILELMITKPKIAILDEIDSGIDVDGLKLISKYLRDIALNDNVTILAITHYARLAEELGADHVHIFENSKITASGDLSLAFAIEKSGYD
jgi:Fe-S cluster assembly ATP-binding protein